MKQKKDFITLVILTYNAERFLDGLFQSIRIQSAQFEILVIDSESSDNTHSYLKSQNIDFLVIPKSEFNHGGTRNLGLNLAKGEIVVFVTQDVVFCDSHSIERLIEPIVNNSHIAMSYGRQLPKPDATLLSEFARLNNYSDENLIKSKQDINKLGIKTCFISNSFAAYNKQKIIQLGLFPSHLIMCEDVYIGAKAILNNFKIAYVSNARVFHSHNYSVLEEFKRYFDIGCFYHSESWIIKSFKSAESEGLTYLKREFKFLVERGGIPLVPEFFVRSALKYLGYMMGRYEKVIPLRIKRKLSMHSYFWTRKKTINKK